MYFFMRQIIQVSAVLALYGCAAPAGSMTEPKSVADAKAVFNKMRAESEIAIDFIKRCESLRKNKSDGWALACIESNDQRMKLSLMESEYANAGVRLSGWGISLLQSPNPDSYRANELQLFLDDVEYFKDKAEDMFRSQLLPRCLASVYSNYGSFVPPNCCDFYQRNLPDNISTRFCNVETNKSIH